MKETIPQFLEDCTPLVKQKAGFFNFTFSILSLSRLTSQWNLLIISSTII